MRMTPLTIALAIVPILAACRSTPTTVCDPGLASRADTAEEWISAARQPFDAREPGRFASPAMLAAFDGARIVGIGEATHGTHEDGLLKTHLILALIDEGAVETLYLEANRAGAAQLDAFIRSSEGDADAAVRDSSVFRVLKTEAFAACVAGMRDRVRRGARLRIVGIDCQDTARDANFALDALARRDVALAADLRVRLEPVAGENARAIRHPELIKAIHTAQLEAGVAALSELEGACLRFGEGDAVAAARAARQGLLAFRLEVGDGDQSKINGEYVSLRDKFMAENILADGPRRGAFWGHNRHVIGGRVPNGPEFWSPTGAFLRDALGEQYRTVIFDYARGTIRIVVRSGNTLPDATMPAEVISRGMLEKGYARAIAGPSGGSWWIDLRAMPAGSGFDVWRSTVRFVDWMGYFGTRERDESMLDPFAIDRHADVLVVIDEVSAAKPL
jgi:erythromycin esterase